MKILAIDDREDNLVALTATLKAYVADCEVKTATTGLAGLNLARTYQPDTILLAIQMPGLDGYEVCKLLKNYSVTRHIPIIFLTAQKPNAATQVLALNLGADGFINTPVEPIALAAQVRAMVRIKVAEDALRAEKQSLERAVAERTAALQAETTKLDAIFDSSPVAMLVLDEKMSVVRRNAAAAALADGNLAGARPTVVGQGSGQAASATGSAAPHPGGGQPLSHDSGLSGETPSPPAPHGSAGASPYHHLNGNSLVPNRPPRPGDALGCVHRTEDPRGCGYAPNCPLCPLRQGVDSVMAGGAAVRGVELALDLLRDGHPQKVWLRVGTEHILIAGHRHVVVALDDITERKQAEEALRVHQIELEMQNAELRRTQAALAAARARYFDLYDLAPVSYVTVSESGLILEANLTAATLLGMARSALVEQPLAHFIFPEDQDIYYRHRQEVTKTGARQACELRMARSDGSPFWARLETTLAPDAAGASVLRVVLTDITERKRAEAVLQESHRQNQEILDSIADAFISLTDDLVVSYFNPAAERMLNRRRADVIGRNLFAAFPEAKGSIFEEKYSQAIRTKSFLSFEVQFTVAPYQNWYDVRVYPSRAGITIYFQVITERKQVEAALQASNELISRFIRHSPIYAYIKAVTPTESRVLQASDNFQQMLGCSGKEIVGKTMAELFPSDLAAKMTADDWTVVTKGEVLRLDEDLQGRHYSSIKFPIVQGDKTLLAGYTIDITAHKQTEEALLLFRRQLRALSARQATLREEERTRIAREIHDELGQMLTGLKMDLSLAESMVVDVNEARLNPLLDKLVAATELTDATITTVQRIASELRPGVLDRLGLLMGLHYEANQFERRSGLRCKLTLPQEEPAVSPAVATAFFRIFQEALTNVTRHAAAKSVQGTFRSEAGQWVLEVQDDGRGIAEAEVTNPHSLGLLGMQERARLLGGTVTFRRAATGGTVVELRLPRRDEAPTVGL